MSRTGSKATARTNKYAADCAACGQHVHALDGRITREFDRETGTPFWRVVHRPVEWTGSPISGRWAGGCPEPQTTGTQSDRSEKCE